MAARHRVALLAGVLVLVSVLVLAACGGDDGESGGAGGTVSVALGTSDNEYAMTPNPAEAAAGSVTFTVTNGGKLQHEMVVIRTDKGAANLGVDGEADESGAVDEITVDADQSGDLTVDLPAGAYALVCNLAGHYQAGMYADFSVK